MKTKLVYVLVIVLAVAMLIVACAKTPAEQSTTTAKTQASSNESTKDETKVTEPTKGQDVFLKDKPQIKKPVKGIDVIDVVEATKPKAEYPKYNWTFALHNYASDFQSSIDIAKGVREEAKKYGIKVVEADCQMDVNKIPANIENFLLQKVDLIIDATWIGGEAGVKTAMEKSVPTVTFDSPFYPGYSWTVGGHNALSGQAIGKHMAKVVKEKWGGKVDYLCITWPQSVGESMQLRMQSAIDGLKEGGIDIPKDRIVWFDSQGQAIKVKSIVADFLTAHPDSKKILFGGNNGDAGVGMLSAVETAGRSNDCMIYTYGAEQAAIDNFKGPKNCWVADVGYYFKQYGALAVQTAVRVMNGEKVSEYISPEMFIVDHDTVKDYKGQ